MPEQEPQNLKAFDPASFSMPTQPSLTYRVIANPSVTDAKISSYVQTVFIRPSGTITPGARLSDQSLSDQAPVTIRDGQAIGSGRQTTSGYQGWSVQERLSDQGMESATVPAYRSDQNKSFAPPADRSNLSSMRRTDVHATRQQDSSATVIDAMRENDQQTETHRSVDQQPQVAVAKTKLVDLRQGAGAEAPLQGTPQRDQNTIAQEPEAFLKREAFSNKFRVTAASEREFARTENAGKIIYLKSVPPKEQTDGSNVSELAHRNDRASVGKLTVTPAEPLKAAVTSEQPRAIEPIQPQPQPPQPQIIRWPIVDAAQDQVLFPAPVVTVSPLSSEIDFVSTAPPRESETTKIDFAEVNMKVSQEPASAPPVEAAFDPFQSTEAAFDPFQSAEAPAALDQSSPFQSLPDPTPEPTPEPTPFSQSPPSPPSPVKSSPFQSTPEQSSPFESSPFESSPTKTSPFEPAPPKTSPFQSAPAETSPFRSTLSESPSLRFDKQDVTASQQKEFGQSVDNFPVPSPPVSSVSLAGKPLGEVSDLAVSPLDESNLSEIPFDAPAKSTDSYNSSFHLSAHRRTEFTKGSEPIESELTTTASTVHDTSPTKQLIVPTFKSSSALENVHQHFTATTLQTAHLSEPQRGQQFETPWLSPWWMLIGLIPVMLYVATMKLFKDEDEYHRHQNELFDSHLDFGSDFGEIGRSKSDATYGRHEEVPIVAGPSGEPVRLDVDPARSTIAFAESLKFEIPSSAEIAQPAFAPELRIDQSPNFATSDTSSLAQQKTGKQKRKRPNTGRTRNKR